MQLPDLPGYAYKALLEEDAFGWSFVADYQGSETRVVKVLKAQATADHFLYPYLKELSTPGSSLAEIAKVYDYSFQNHKALTAIATPFYGWKSKEANKWQQTSIKRLMRVISSEQSRDIILDLARVIQVMHKEGVFHGGLRPGTIFLTGDAENGHEVKVSDFGQIFMGGIQYLECGDLLFYASPEQMSTGDFTDDKAFAWDIYAFGAIAFQLLTGHLPRLDVYRQQSVENPDWLHRAPAISVGQLSEFSEQFLSRLESEKSVEWPSEAEDDIDQGFRSVIQSCLYYDPASRPESMAAVVESLEKVKRSSKSKLKAKNKPKPKKENAVVAVSPRVAPVTPFVEEEPVATPEPIVEEDTSAVAEGFEDEIAADIPEEDSPSYFPEIELAGIGEKRNPIERLKSNPTVMWQVIAICALVAMLPLSFFGVFNYWQLRGTKSEMTVQNAELQANVEQQAAAYQRVLLEKQNNQQQLKSELNEAEDSRSQLLGEAELARQIVRQTQENGDRFFRLVLENRDTDVPGFRDSRARAIMDGRSHYERLVEVYGDAPDFIVSTANAFFYLGQIYHETGEFGKALASYGEAERRYMALLENERTSSVDYIRNIAVAKNSLGNLSMKVGEHSVARHYFTESSRFWTEVRSRKPEEGLNSAIAIHNNSLSIVECEFAMESFEAALDAARSTGVQLADLMESKPNDDRIVGALARSFALSGRVFEALGKINEAGSSFQQASDLYAQAIKMNAAIDRYQLGLGNSLARTGLLKNETEKLKGAAEVLAGVVASNPYESVYIRTLADVYGVLASNQRDGGRLQNAIDLEREALKILKPIVENQSVAPDVKFSYAQRLSHLAELLGDANKFDDSRVPLREAITVLEEVTASSKSLAIHQRALARARGLAGFACIKSGDKNDARQHLELAKADWDSYIQANPNDSDAEQAAKWTSDQLRRL